MLVFDICNSRGAVADSRPPAPTIRIGQTSCKSLSGHSNPSHRHLIVAMWECVSDIHDTILMQAGIYKHVCVKERHLTARPARSAPVTAGGKIYLQKTTTANPTNSPVCSFLFMCCQLHCGGHQNACNITPQQDLIPTVN